MFTKIFDVEKIVKIQMIMESVRNALSKLNDEEREIIEILEKLGELIKEFE